MKQMAVWCLVLILTFFAGFFAHLLFEKNSVSDSQYMKQGLISPQVQNTENINIIKKDKDFWNANKQSDVSSFTNAEFSYEAIATELEMFVKSTRGNMTFSEISRLYALVGEVSEDKLLGLLQKFSIDSLENDNAAFSVLFNKYAEHAPSEAINFILTEISDKSAQGVYIGSVLKSMAKETPLLAYEHFLNYSSSSANASNRKQAILDGSLVSIFQNMAEYDNALAIDKLIELNQQGYDVDIAILGLTNAFESQLDFTSLLVQLQVENNDALENSVIYQWTRNNPEQIGAWLTEEYSGNRYNEIHQELIESWSNVDPKSAADWAVAHSQPDQLKGNINSIMRNWGYDNPDEAVEWFVLQPAEVYNQNTFTEFLKSVVYREPQFASRYLHYIDDEQNRSLISQQIYQGFKRTNTAQAKAFLEQSPFRDDILEVDELINK